MKAINFDSQIRDKRTGKLRLKVGRHRADRSLFVLVREGGAVYWVQRIKVGGRIRDLGLGPYPEISIVDAKAAALENRRRVLAGEPIQTRATVNRPTFAAVVKTWLQGQVWKDTTRANQIATLDRHVLPQLGESKIGSLTAGSIVNAIVKIADRSKTEAVKAKGMIQSIMAFATAREIIAVNPIPNGTMDAGLPQTLRKLSVVHHASLAYAAVPAFVAKLKDDTIGRATLFIILSALRAREATELRWSEVDFTSRTIVVNCERMKGGRDHRIPMTDQIFDLLQAQHGKHPSIVFPSPRKAGQPITTDAVGLVLKRNGVAGTIHGFRTSFRHWCRDTAVDDATAETSLAHCRGGKVQQAYDRSDMLDQRRAVLADWNDYVAPR